MTTGVGQRDPEGRALGAPAMGRRRTLFAYVPLTMATDRLAPMRLAPARIMARAVAASRIPPDALTPNAGPTVARINATSASVAPAVPNPVDVFTK